jgi:hypothetical protein
MTAAPNSKKLGVGRTVLGRLIVGNPDQKKYSESNRKSLGSATTRLLCSPQVLVVLRGTSISGAGRLDRSQASCHAAQDFSAYGRDTLIN